MHGDGVSRLAGGFLERNCIAAQRGNGGQDDDELRGAPARRETEDMDTLQRHHATVLFLVSSFELQS
jgi:hypothetical protein